MDIYKLIGLFGKESKDKELIDFFEKESINILKKLEIEEDTFYAFIEDKKKGIELIFKDELEFFNLENRNNSKNINYYFECIHCFAQDIDDCNEYKGELLNGIKMSNTKDEIRDLMKKPYKRHGFLDVDIWNNLNGCQVFVDYKERNTPAIISISMEPLTNSGDSISIKKSKKVSGLDF